MKARRLRFGLRTVLLGVAVCALLSLGLRSIGRYWLYDRHENKYSGKGYHFIHITMEDGTQQKVRLYDPGWVMNRKVAVDELLNNLQTYIMATRKPQGSHKSDSKPSALKAGLSAELLVGVKHPKACELIIKLLDDPNSGVRYYAAYCLARLGDKKALPYLRQSLRNGSSVDGSHENVLISFGDPIVIPDLIDAMRPDEGLRIETSLRAIEKLSGLSIQEIERPWRDCRIEMPQFKRGLHQWWEKTKHKVLNPTPAAAAGPTATSGAAETLPTESTQNSFRP